jgi:hypothetical protein
MRWAARILEVQADAVADAGVNEQAVQLLLLKSGVIER